MSTDVYQITTQDACCECGGGKKVGVLACGSTVQGELHADAIIPFVMTSESCGVHFSSCNSYHSERMRVMDPELKTEYCVSDRESCQLSCELEPDEYRLVFEHVPFADQQYFEISMTCMKSQSKKKIKKKKLSV